jgi:hypothetical protein
VPNIWRPGWSLPEYQQTEGTVANTLGYLAVQSIAAKAQGTVFATLKNLRNVQNRPNKLECYIT